MRSLKTIDQDIDRCKAQIAKTYEANENLHDAQITREGFQQQLAKLQTERAKAQGLYNIELINPKIVRA